MDKELIETIRNKNKDKKFTCEYIYPELIAQCPTTGLPDLYEIKIIYEPNEYIIELKSLKMYLIGYKNKGIYHEELINEIFDDIKEIIIPKWIFIELKVNIRGGIYTVVKRFWDKNKGELIEPIINFNKVK